MQKQKGKREAADWSAGRYRWHQDVEEWGLQDNDKAISDGLQMFRDGQTSSFP